MCASSLRAPPTWPAPSIAPGTTAALAGTTITWRYWRTRRWTRVVIATPHALHATQALDAVRAGKHVLVEKPMATRWEEAVALVEGARLAGVTLFPLPFQAYPELLVMQRYLREEVIGKLVAAEAHLSLPGPPRANWYYSRAAEGGAMLDTMVYALNSLADVLGPAARVGAMVNMLIPRRRTGDGGRVHTEVDDNVSLLLEYPTGQHATVRSCWGPAFKRNATIFYGRHGTIFLHEGGQSACGAEPAGAGYGRRPDRVHGPGGLLRADPADPGAGGGYPGSSFAATVRDGRPWPQQRPASPACC